MIAFSLNAARGYVIISVKDAPTLDEYIEASRALGAHDNFYATTHRICDFTRVGDLSVSIKEVVAFAEEAKRLPREPGAKIALVAKTEKDREIMQLFVSQFDDPENFRVFETGRDALAWILWADKKAPKKAPVQKKASDEIRLHRLSGSVTAENVTELQSDWFNDDKFDKDAPILWDLRLARFETELSNIESLAGDMHKSAMQVRPEGKAAMLVSSELHARTLEYGFQKGIEIGRTRIFTDESEAENWLLEKA